MAKLVEKAERLPSISAFSASLSQRSCNIRQLATTSGELAILARRAQSAACSRQYLAYDDITRSLTHRYPNALPSRKLGCRGGQRRAVFVPMRQNSRRKERLGPTFRPAVALRSQPVELQAAGLSDSEPHMSIGRGSDVSLW